MKNKIKIFLLITVIGALLISATGCNSDSKDVPNNLDNQTDNNSTNKGEKTTLNVFNYGIYMDQTLLTQFEKENNVKINYEEYPTPEDMYIKAKTGGTKYDVIITGEYMIERMINEDMLQPINIDNIPNYQYVGDQFKNQPYDPENEYAVPYFWGTLGILYNKNTVDVSSGSWDILWNEENSGKIIMMDSQRDSFAVALKLLGYSLNTINEKELDEAKELLEKQKPLVMAYITDGAVDTMINEEADMALVWSGEAVTAMQENENLDFLVAKEGGNIWIDAMCVPKDAQNKDMAEKFINFLTTKEATLKNIDEVLYSTVHTEALKEVPEELLNNTAFNLDEDLVKNMEMFRDSKEFIELYSKRWTEIMAKNIK